MALDLFRVSLGLDIESSTGSSNSYILQGIGLPGGDGAEQDAAPIGSLYMRNDTELNNLQLYYKFTTANNSSADWKVVTDKAYVDAVAAGISWREPALVLDTTNYADITAAETAANVSNTVDGVSINTGDRILFSNLTTGNNNVYIVSGSPGAWTFTEDTNAATDGDAVLIQSGTHAEEQWVFDGLQWVQFGSAAGAQELNFIRQFIGKTGPGSEFPTYSSTDVITQSSPLETSVGQLDSAFGTGSITNDNTNNPGANFALSDDMSWGTGTLKLTDALNDLNDAIGDRTYTNDNVVVDGQTIAQSIDSLDTAIGNINNQNSVITGTNVVANAGVTVDTLPLASATEAEWMIQIRETATPSNRRAYRIHALNDGATLIDFDRSSNLKLGSNISGLKVEVDILGTDMRLRVTATNNIDYVVRRIAFSAL